jgi:hypothetical protein
MIKLISVRALFGLASLALSLALTFSSGASAQDEPAPTPSGRLRIEDGNRRLPENARRRLDEIRDRVRRDPGRLVADPDDEDTWASYVAAAGGLALVGLGLFMVRRDESD